MKKLDIFNIVIWTVVATVVTLNILLYVQRLADKKEYYYFCLAVSQDKSIVINQNGGSMNIQGGKVEFPECREGNTIYRFEMVKN